MAWPRSVSTSPMTARGRPARPPADSRVSWYAQDHPEATKADDTPDVHWDWLPRIARRTLSLTRHGRDAGPRSLDVGGDLHLHHLVGIGDGFATLELVDHLHARHHLANHGVLAVQR